MRRNRCLWGVFKGCGVRGIGEQKVWNDFVSDTEKKESTIESKGGKWCWDAAYFNSPTFLDESLPTRKNPLGFFSHLPTRSPRTRKRFFERRRWISDLQLSASTFISFRCQYLGSFRRKSYWRCVETSLRRMRRLFVVGYIACHKSLANSQNTRLQSTNTNKYYVCVWVDLWLWSHLS